MFLCFNIMAHSKQLDLKKLYDITISNTMLLDFLHNYILTTMKNYFLCAQIPQQQPLHQQITLTSLPKSQRSTIVTVKILT